MIFTNMFSLTFTFIFINCSNIHLILVTPVCVWPLNYMATNTVSSPIATGDFCATAIVVLLVALLWAAMTWLVWIYRTLLATSATEMKNKEELLEDIRDDASVNFMPEKGEYRICNGKEQKVYKLLNIIIIICINSTLEI